MGRPLKAQTSRAVYQAAESASTLAETTQLALTNGEEPQVTALVWKVSESFRRFAKKARKLSRMTSKGRGPVSSEAYNYLMEQQIRELKRTFDIYLQSREEMRYYIEATYWRSKYYNRTSKGSAKSHADQEGEVQQSFRTAS